MDHKVFISYSSPDKTTAVAVCSTLESRGIPCWIAPRDIAPGADWASSIVDGIVQAKIMVVVFSTHANDSRQVMREVERAVSQGIVIIPFRLEDIPFSKTLAYFLGACHWLDSLSPPRDGAIEILADTIGPYLQGDEVALERTATSQDSAPTEQLRYAKRIDDLLDQFKLAFAKAGLEEGPGSIPVILDYPVISLLAWNSELNAREFRARAAVHGEEVGDKAFVLECFHWLVEGYCLGRFLATESLAKERLPVELPDTKELIARWRDFVISKMWATSWADGFASSLVEGLQDRAKTKMAVEFGGRILAQKEENNINDSLFFMGLSVLQGVAAYRFVMLGGPLASKALNPTGNKPAS